MTIEIKEMKKVLSYTKEMQEQDMLWHEQKEDFFVMEKLFNEIIEEAKTLGLRAITRIHQGPGECVCDIYDSLKEEYDGYTEFSFGFCKPLIETIEKYYLNKNVA